MQRRKILLLSILFVAVLVASHAAFYEPKQILHRVSVEPVQPFHALIFRYDTENSTLEQLERLIEQDERLGLRASAFPLTQDFNFSRNVLFDYTLRAGDVHLHARPMPWGLMDAHAAFGDATPYQYFYLDRDQISNAYFHNLLPEIAIFEYNGFEPTGLSLHSTTNRLPWDDDTNYRVIGAAAARAGLEWVSVTSQKFSIGSDRNNMDRSRFNRYDADITSRQRSFWLDVSIDWWTRRSVLIVPTSWRDHYQSESTEPDDVRKMYENMLRDINRHWKVAKSKKLALVLLFHPRRHVGLPVTDALFFDFRRMLVERARSEDIPILTFSEYTKKMASMR